MADANTTVSFILNNIRNPCWSGKSRDFKIKIIDPNVTEEEEAEALAAREEMEKNGEEVKMMNFCTNVEIKTTQLCCLINLTDMLTQILRCCCVFYFNTNF